MPASRARSESCTIRRQTGSETANEIGLRARRRPGRARPSGPGSRRPAHGCGSAASSAMPGALDDGIAARCRARGSSRRSRARSSASRRRAAAGAPGRRRRPNAVAGEVHQHALGADRVEAALGQVERRQVALDPLDVVRRRRARDASSSALRSSPVTATPGCGAASRRVSRPTPQPASSSRMPGAGASASRSARWTAWVPGQPVDGLQERGQLARFGLRGVGGSPRAGPSRHMRRGAPRPWRPAFRRSRKQSTRWFCISTRSHRSARRS